MGNSNKERLMSMTVFSRMQLPLQIVLFLLEQGLYCVALAIVELAIRLVIWGLNFFLNVGTSLLKAWHGSICL